MSEKVVTHLARTKDEERVVIETYLPSMEAGRLALSQRVERVTTVTDDGSRTVDQHLKTQSRRDERPDANRPTKHDDGA